MKTSSAGLREQVMAAQAKRAIEEERAGSVWCDHFRHVRGLPEAIVQATRVIEAARATEAWLDSIGHGDAEGDPNPLAAALAAWDAGE